MPGADSEGRMADLGCIIIMIIMIIIIMKMIIMTWAADVVASETLDAPAEAADSAADNACRSIVHHHEDIRGPAQGHMRTNPHRQGMRKAS